MPYKGHPIEGRQVYTQNCERRGTEFHNGRPINHADKLDKNRDPHENMRTGDTHSSTHVGRGNEGEGGSRHASVKGHSFKHMRSWPR